MNARVPVCVFAKPPVAGSVKTRLANSEHAARLARAFLVDTCDSLRAIAWIDPILATTGPLAPSLAQRVGVPIWPQGDGDLGARIERVMIRALGSARGAIAIGADTPGLPRELLDRAGEALTEADAAIGPTDDGGFYLLALRACPVGLLAELPWSRSDTFAMTLGRLRERGLRTRVLDPWFDIDRPADLARLHALLTTRVLVAPETFALISATSSP